MPVRIRFGRPGKKTGRGSRIWSILRAILSGIFLTSAILLVLVAVSELIVYFIDVVIMGNETYMDWGRAPLIIFLASLPLFVIYLLLNLDRFKFGSRLIRRFRTSKPPKEVETIDLD